MVWHGFHYSPPLKSIREVGNLVYISCGTPEGSAQNHLLFLWFNFWPWLKFFNLNKPIACYSSWWFNLFNNRHSQSNHCSCMSTNIDCLFLIMYDLYWMSSDCALRQLEISGNGPYSSIHIDNVLYPQYKFWCPDNVWILWMLFVLHYRWHILTGRFQLLLNCVHKQLGDFQKMCNISTSLCFACITTITACCFP